jgi:glycosyltransferase involved in cell wall biosynthesis
MIILHIAPIVTETVNGLRFSVPGLIRAQIRQGESVACLNIKHSDQAFDFGMFELTDIKNLPKPFDKPDIVIFHSVYWRVYLSLVKQITCPYIIVPRSSMTIQAQRQRRLKKWLGNLLLFNRFIKGSAKIHYLNQEEADQSLWVGHPYFIVPNGMDLPLHVEKIKQNQSIRFATIGRYDLNHKGLDLLIDAIRLIEKMLKELKAEFHFYGSDHKNNKAAFRGLIERTSLEDLVFIHDAVYGEEKHKVLLATDLFISTSRFEGHPMAVLEAMAYGIPCILTPGTNMLQACVDADAGWQALSDSKSIAQAIVLALGQKDEWINKGHNARRLIESRYGWDMIGSKSIENYKSVLISKNV